MSLEVRGLRKAFDGTPILRGVDLSVGKGECVVILGPSGCGKSTLLRLIAGLEQADGGSVSIGERDITALSPRERNIALVFQRYALYGHRTVEENVAYPLRIRRVPARDRTGQVDSVLRELEITPLRDRFPGVLSGGEQQRVALGRALVRRPDAFLLDEPLSSVDPSLRESLRAVLERVYRRAQVPAIHVTHDQEEALLLGDRIAVLLGGTIQQCASPAELLTRPCTSEVGLFVGRPRINLGRAMVTRDGEDTFLLFRNNFRLLFPRGRLERVETGTRIVCGIRPWAAECGSDGLRGVVTARRLSPPFIRLEIEMEDCVGTFVLLSAPAIGSMEGEHIRVLPKAEDIICFDARTGVNLE